MNRRGLSILGFETLDWRTVGLLALVGVMAGVLSGLFGVGGGSIIVPALVWAGLSQKEASATSLASMILMSVSGVASYAAAGNVDWLAALMLTLGTVAGTQVGTWLLDKLPEAALRWLYVIFLCSVIAEQLMRVPERNSRIVPGLGSSLTAIGVGILIGLLSGLLGVGGGGVAVPALTMMGASDLVARGTSLLAIFPSSVSGTAANMRRGLVHLRNGLLVGFSAAVSTPLGSLAARSVSARAGTYLFVLYLMIVVARSIYAAAKVTPGLHTAHRPH
ncbi:sulfite exporter TauE/SafE family protein [Bifidobacterium xylocopae]|uniref:sulfite exporter TauE/SafE family protein n=1 Tax=Bifidobacterium xylocopae TaxID=2493119 RepID=UPI001F225398|nr:sulfite exporter TauE/SafE family protein [Bifidobacterium xylocopae]